MGLIRHGAPLNVWEGIALRIGYEVLLLIDLDAGDDAAAPFARSAE